MRLFLIIWLLTIVAFHVTAQTRSTRTRQRIAGYRPERVGVSDGTLFLFNRDCINSDCPCCLFMKHGTIEGIEVDTTYCKTSNSGMDNVEEIWGPMQSITISGRAFQVFNATSDQVAVITEVLSILPAFYLSSVPSTIRIGNTSNGSILTSETASVVSVPRRDEGTRDVLKGDRYDETIGGGSRRCLEKNDPYEYIILHPLVFTHARENPRRTILHEVGHFVDRDLRISNRSMRLHRAEFRAYLDRYRGDSRNWDEVIAQGIMYYYLSMYWPRNGSAPAEVRAIPPDFPQWLLDIIRADIESRE